MIISAITHLKPGHIILILAVLLFPYLSLFWMLQPISLFEKNAFLILTVGLIVYVYLHNILLTNKGRVRFEEIVSLFLFSLFMAILGVRYLYYGESKSILYYQHFILPFIFLFFSKRLIKQPPTTLVIGYVLVISALLQSAFVIIHSIWFSNIQLIADDSLIPSLSFDSERARDGLLGASLGSYQIVCGMFVLYAYNNIGLAKGLLASLSYYLMLLIMFYAILISASRYPIIVAMLLIFADIGIMRNLISKKGFAFVVVAVFASTLFLFYFEPIINLRLGEGSGGRIGKLLLSLTLLTDNSINFLLGASSETVVMAVTSDGLQVSDNSYMLIALEAGVPFALLFYVVLITHMNKVVRGALSHWFLAFIVVGLSFTNSILWTSWIFIAMITLVVISHLSNERYPQRSGKRRWLVPVT